MNETVEQWLKISANDHEAAISLMAAANPAFYASVCFHCQQSIEKLFKAALVRHGRDFEKTHDLLKLKLLLDSIGVLISEPERELAFLGTCAVEFRYPGEEATLEDAQDAIAICERIRSALLPGFSTT
jgi:HEPN domain-containing protein